VHHGLMMKLASVQVGRPRTVPRTGDGQPWDREWRTAFWKDPVDGPVMLLTLNLDGDGHADLEGHGGPDQAALCYSAEHYPRWREELTLPEMPFGGFGENLTIAGQDEHRVCIGDVYSLGGALIQVSKPRGPCFKISWRWQRADLLARVEASGRHGWYVRVLREGLVEAGQEVSLEEQPHPDWTVRAAGDVIRFRKRRPELAAQLARCEALATEDRVRLREAALRSLRG
jgi:MOSC domain-containing protein YiiM